VVLQPKQQKDIFFVPRQPGRYALSCADHDWEGMVGDITVE
jgi:plastocyanin